MDHSHYLYSARQDPQRQSVLPGTGLMAYAVLFLEHWAFEPPPGALKDPRMVGEFGSFSPDYRSWTQREYGLRIGVFRLLDALADAGITPVVAANAAVLQRVPKLVAQLNRMGCEWLGHGLMANHIMHSRMPLAEQRAHIGQSLSSLQLHTGAPALGWISQDWGTTPDTYQLLAQAGVQYTLDWNNDDQPYWLTTPVPGSARKLASIPFSSEWDDVQCQWLRNLTPQSHGTMAVDAMRYLQAESEQEKRPSVFGLGLHPWLCGMANRIAHTRRMLTELRRLDGVQWVMPRDIYRAMGQPAIV